MIFQRLPGPRWLLLSAYQAVLPLLWTFPLILQTTKPCAISSRAAIVDFSDGMPLINLGLPSAISRARTVARRIKRNTLPPEAGRSFSNDVVSVNFVTILLRSIILISAPFICPYVVLIVWYDGENADVRQMNRRPNWQIPESKVSNLFWKELSI